MNAETELGRFAASAGASALEGMLGMASGIFLVTEKRAALHDRGAPLSRFPSVPTYLRGRNPFD